MPDNRQIKDGLGNLFTLRMRDVSLNGDGSVQRNMMLDTLYPVDYGYGGVFQHCAKSGVINAAIASQLADLFVSVALDLARSAVCINSSSTPQCLDRGSVCVRKCHLRHLRGAGFYRAGYWWHRS